MDAFQGYKRTFLRWILFAHHLFHSTFSKQLRTTPSTMPIEAYPIPPFKPDRFKRPFPTDPEDFVVLSSDDEQDGRESDSTAFSSPSPSKTTSGSSSVQTTPSPAPAKKQMLVFGKPARPFSEDENKLIVDHLLQACNLAALQKVMDRSRTTVLRQVEGILQRGLQSFTKKSK